MEEPIFSYTKHPYYRVIINESNLSVGKKIVGWWIYHPPDGCCTLPKPSKLSLLGWISTGVLTFIFWPLSCTPCFLSSCYDGYQTPIFENELPFAQPILFQPTAPLYPSK